MLVIVVGTLALIARRVHCGDRPDPPLHRPRLTHWQTDATLGRSQVVRQRVLVPRSQVRILAPQPSLLTRRPHSPQSSWPQGSARACAPRRRSTCTRCSAAAWSTGSLGSRALGVGADPLVVVVSEETHDAFPGETTAVQRDPRGTGDAVATRARGARGLRAATCSCSPATRPLLTAELLRGAVETHRRERRRRDRPLLRAARRAALRAHRARHATATSQAIVEARDATPEQLAIRELNSLPLRLQRAADLWLGARALDRRQRPGRALPDRHRRRPRRATGASAVVHRTDDSRSPDGINTRAELAAAAATLRDRVNDAHMARRRRRSSTRRAPGSTPASSSRPTARSIRSRSCGAPRGRRRGRSRAPRGRDRRPHRSALAGGAVLLPSPRHGARGRRQGGHVCRDQEHAGRRGQRRSLTSPTWEMRTSAKGRTSAQAASRRTIRIGLGCPSRRTTIGKERQDRDPQCVRGPRPDRR